MIKRKKPLLRSAPIKRSAGPIKRKAPAATKLKHCDIGNHEVMKLFRAHTKTQDSCCSNCRIKTPIKKSDVVNTVKKQISKKPKADSLLGLVLKVEKVFNLAIRKRDIDDDGRANCISCGKSFSFEDLDCGHFISKMSSMIRFNEDNCHAECVGCNRMNDDHLIGYENNLIKKIGYDRVQDLYKQASKTNKWDRSVLNELYEKYK